MGLAIVGRNGRRLDPADDRDANAIARLASAAGRKMAAGRRGRLQLLLAREPDYVSLRNDAALIYMELGQPAKALEHFAAVTRLQPRRRSRVQRGRRVEAMGNFGEARGRYLEATRLDPQYSAAHNNLANVLYRGGDVGGAETHYRTAVSADPSNAEAHCA